MKIYLLLALLTASPAAFSDTALDLDPAKTEIAFTLHDPLHTVHGTFKLKRGSLLLDPEHGKASGEIVVDATSGQSGSNARDSRMHKEILESRKYPEATFVADSMQGKLEREGASQIDVHGAFTIHGASHQLTLHFQVAANNSQYTGTARFDIPYVEWGMKDPSNFLLKVEKKVEMEVKTVATAH
jgi:polyisoprenoid-binding protein YceI